MWPRLNFHDLRFARYLKLRLVRTRAVEIVADPPDFGQARRPTGRAALDEGAASATPRPDRFVVSRSVRPTSEASQAETLRASHCRRMLRPNKSFKPMPLRGTA